MIALSVLFREPADRYEAEQAEQPSCFPDLYLDQIHDSITAGRDEYALSVFFYCTPASAHDLQYRHEVFTDLASDAVYNSVKTFQSGMRKVRHALRQAAELRYRLQKHRWHLDAAKIYCGAVRRLSQELHHAEPASEALNRVLRYLDDYLAGAAFRALESEVQRISSKLDEITYCIQIRGRTVSVYPWEGQPDYASAVEHTFRKFRSEGGRSYLAEFNEYREMNHVETRILERVSRIFASVFDRLDEFVKHHEQFVDETVSAFDRDIQFYLAVVEYLHRFRETGLSFCLPKFVDRGEAVFVRNGFDLALAGKPLEERDDVVTNSLETEGAERIVVVSGPNQGGKTTYARQIGQLFYLAALGCPVPGTEAQVHLVDRVLTHFEVEETIEDLRGKLMDDLLRVRRLLGSAGPDSVVIFNELFSSTTSEDALHLSAEILGHVSQLKCFAVWVTFIHELAEFNEHTVSMVGLVDRADPSRRTYRIVRRPPDGVSYALTVAEQHRVTYRALKHRLSRR